MFKWLFNHIFDDKDGCRIVGSVTIVWLTTGADDQSSLMRTGNESLGRSAILHAFMLGAESDVYTILIITALWSWWRSQSAMCLCAHVRMITFSQNER